MSHRPIVLGVTALMLGALLLPAPVEGQLPDLRRIVETSVESEINRALEAKIRDAVRCALGDTACVERARQDGQTTVFEDEDGQIITDADGQPITDPDDARAATDEVGTGVWTNYDFVPGNTVAYALDLESERVGRFPARQLEFVQGNAQIVERDGVRQLQITSPTTFRVRLPETLPDDYTLEFDFQASRRNTGVTIANGEMPGNMGSYAHDYLGLAYESGIMRTRQVVSSNQIDRIDHEMVPFKLQVDRDPEMGDANADYSILYAGMDRVAQVPNADFERNDLIEFHVLANADYPSYLSDIVVAFHGDPLYESLTTGDRTFTTRGIQFDFDSDRLRGESTPTLDEIRRTMESNAGLTLVIEGHTDDAGEEEYNQELSERRAEAVVAYLIANGIGEGRLTAVGAGESEPVADNETESGRRQNRRVVIRNTSDM